MSRRYKGCFGFIMFEVFWPEDKFQLLLRCDNPNLREEINPTNVKYFYSSMVRSSLVD